MSLTPPGPVRELDRKDKWIRDEKFVQWVVRGTGTPKDRDEVNRREVSECDG